MAPTPYRRSRLSPGEILQIFITREPAGATAAVPRPKAPADEKARAARARERRGRAQSRLLVHTRTSHGFADKLIPA